VALTICSDISAADWIVGDVPWTQLATFGPTGFAAYGRLRFLSDPSYEGQREKDADRDGAPCAAEQWQALFELLVAHTPAPDDCYFALWDGWGFPESTRRLPKFSITRGARFPARSYFLFHGSLSDAGHWGAEFSSAGPPPYEPAFVWPADRAWCVANDLGPHWVGIGADAALIKRLVADPRLDAVAADPTGEQPTYR
jgi:hypothetical protein